MRVLSRMTILARRDAQFRRKDRREYSATQKEKAGEDSRNEGPMCSWYTLKTTYVSQLVPEKSTGSARGTRGSTSQPAASDLNRPMIPCRFARREAREEKQHNPSESLSRVHASRASRIRSGFRTLQACLMPLPEDAPPVWISAQRAVIAVTASGDLRMKRVLLSAASPGVVGIAERRCRCGPDSEVDTREVCILGSYARGSRALTGCLFDS